MRILMIADYLPYPLVGGDRIRIYNLLRRVARHHEVSLAAFSGTLQDVEGVPHLQQLCAKVATVSLQRHSKLARIPGLLLYGLQGKPPELKFLYSEALVRKIRQLISIMDFDIVQIEHSRMGLYLETIPRDYGCKSILMFHNIASQQYKRFSHVEQRLDRKVRTWLNSVSMGYWEPRYAEKFDRCTTVSEVDQTLLLTANPRLKVDVIPNGVDIENYKPLPPLPENAKPSLLFIGNMGYPPCVDAALHFCDKIFPIICQEISAIDLWIVGRDPLPEVVRLNGGNIHVTGRVEDVIPFYQHNAVCVVPLRAGSGTRLKILEAMALGRPVVSTTIGCEGLDVVDGVHLLIANSPQQFAEKTMHLLSDRQFYQFISANGRQLVEARYDWDKIAGRLMEVYTGMLEQRRSLKTKVSKSAQ